jgi:RNA 3'-phosphate cyclase
MIEIDGGHLEGGGQIVRTAIALSAIYNKSVHIFNIRKGRDKPGLRPQHLEGIAAAVKLCEAKVEGLALNSTEISFTPGKIGGGENTIDTRTAGSVTLILQTLVPIGIYVDSPLQLTIRGGTAVPFSPTVEYFRHILCSIIKMLGVKVEIEVKRHGFYPKGGGEIHVRIFPGKLKPLNLTERGLLRQISVKSFASHHLKTARVAERMLDGFTRVIKDADTHCTYVDASSPGCFIASCALHENSIIGADVLGKRGKPAEDVGREAARSLKETMESNAPVDPWMVDQIIPYMALATFQTGEPSIISVPSLTKHAETNIWVVEKLLPVEFDFDEGRLHCRKREQ